MQDRYTYSVDDRQVDITVALPVISHTIPFFNAARQEGREWYRDGHQDICPQTRTRHFPWQSVITEFEGRAKSLAAINEGCVITIDNCDRILPENTRYRRGTFIPLSKSGGRLQVEYCVM